MPAALTQSMIEKLPALPRPQDYRDARLKGLILRVMPTRVKSFYCEYARGKRIWLGRADALGLTEARESARTILADVYRGIDPVEARKPKAEIPTLSAFLTGDYATWARAHHRAYKQNLNRLKTAFKSILNKRLNEVTGLHIERWRAGEIERGLSLETINRDVSSIKACFNRAVDWNILKVNPLAKVKKSRTDDNLKVRFLSDAEEVRLRQAIDIREERRRAERDSANYWRRQRGYEVLPDLRRAMFTDHVKPLILLSMNTGCRRGELFDLTWSNVDLDRRILPSPARRRSRGAHGIFR